MLRGVIASGVACLCMLSIVYVLGIVCALGIVCVRLTLVPSSRRTMAELAGDHGSASQPLKRNGASNNRHNKRRIESFIL